MDVKDAPPGPGVVPGGLVARSAVEVGSHRVLSEDRARPGPLAAVTDLPVIRGELICVIGHLFPRPVPETKGVAGCDSASENVHRVDVVFT